MIVHKRVIDIDLVTNLCLDKKTRLQCKEQKRYAMFSYLAAPAADACSNA